MYVFYQIGISIGMILVALAIHILRQSINESSQFTMVNYILHFYRSNRQIEQESKLAL